MIARLGSSATLLCLTLAVVQAAGPPAAAAQDIFDPPMATIRPTNLELHGQTRVDEYFWLRERENPEVTAYLEAENRYAEAMTAHLEPLRGRLFEEIKGRIKQDDSSVPYRIDEWLYYTRFEDGKQYPIFARKRVDAGAAEVVMLDVNVEAEGHAYFHASADGASPDHRILAWASDTAGRRIYTLRFRDLATGRDLSDVIANVTDNFAWANDSRTIFYTRQDPGTLRWHQVWRHRLGTDPTDDVLVYEETDDTFSSWVFRTKSRQYVMIVSWHTLSAEYRY